LVFERSKMTVGRPRVTPPEVPISAAILWFRVVKTIPRAARVNRPEYARPLKIHPPPRV
jgi:hypothetical protein